MKKQTGASILEKLKMGTISAEERVLLETWYNDYSETAKPVENVDGYVNAMQKMDLSFPFEQRSKSFSIWEKVSIAAAVLAIVGVGLVYFNMRNTRNQPGHMVYKNDISPGNIGATLTLANGRKIRLADMANGELVQQAGIRVTKTANGQLIYQVESDVSETGKNNTLTTAKGETYMVILPDKSRVWLNAATSLTYATNLQKGPTRKVKLEGEGYFEIAKDKARPFVVESRGQQVEVLGTHFNVNAYHDESWETTTLLEGSVRITKGIDKKEIKPGEQALNNGTSIKVVQANLESVTDWKQGEFYLDHINFKMAMRKIARWYDVEIIYNSSVPDDMKIGGWVSRNEKLSSVLKSIEAAGLVRFEVEGRKIYVTK